MAAEIAEDCSVESSAYTDREGDADKVHSAEDKINSWGANEDPSDGMVTAMCAKLAMVDEICDEKGRAKAFRD